MDLRDHWEKEDSPTQKSINTLRDLLGLRVVIDLEPMILWGDLGKHYSSQDIFIPSVVGVIKVWTDCLVSRLESDANAAWTERLLEEISEQGSKALKAGVEARPGSQVMTDFVGARFVIGIPETRPPYSNVSAFFASDFEKLFNVPSRGNVQGTNDDDDWASVALPSRTRDQDRALQANIVPTPLPSLDTIPRPDILFASLTPYHMIVKIAHASILIYGSHQGSLELLEGYLQKYVRNTEGLSIKVPIVKTTLQASHFGYGALFDSLSLTPGDKRADWVDINPIFVLSFIEGVLGYQPVKEGSGKNQWYFKRAEPFPS
ncbi:MAG: hypothetical protein M1827_001869 [Pycnora praestabilis]|nr:MAG: hypothetical protein M1827_001869 [Pycnora praestabilis]